MVTRFQATITPAPPGEVVIGLVIDLPGDLTSLCRLRRALVLAGGLCLVLALTAFGLMLCALP
jgi:hypothetical protein